MAAAVMQWSVATNPSCITTRRTDGRTASWTAGVCGNLSAQYRHEPAAP